jgi:hypothetical protein
VIPRSEALPCNPVREYDVSNLSKKLEDLEHGVSDDELDIVWHEAVDKHFEDLDMRRFVLMARVFPNRRISVTMRSYDRMRMHVVCSMLASYAYECTYVVWMHRMSYICTVCSVKFATSAVNSAVCCNVSRCLVHDGRFTLY